MTSNTNFIHIFKYIFANIMKKGVSKGISVFFEYETQKIVQIKSKKVGVIFRIIQFIIVAYIIG